MVIQALGANIAFKGTNSSNNSRALKAEKSAVPTLLNKEAKMVKPSLATRIAKKAIIIGIGALSLLKLSSCTKEPVVGPDQPVNPPVKPTYVLTEGQKTTNSVYGPLVGDTSMTTKGVTLKSLEYVDGEQGYTNQLEFHNDTVVTKILHADGTELQTQREIISKTDNPNIFNAKREVLRSSGWKESVGTRGYQLTKVGDKTALVTLMNNTPSTQYTHKVANLVNAHDLLSSTKQDWLLTVKKFAIDTAKVVR